MTKLLDNAVAAVRRLSSERQDEIAASILSLAEHDEAEDIDPDHQAAIDEGLAEIERGDFASDEEVAAAFRRFGTSRSGSRSGPYATSSRSRTTSRG